MYKYVFAIVFVFNSLTIVSQNNKIPDGYELITLDGEDAYMNFETGDVIRTVPLKSSQKYINNTDTYEKSTSIHTVSNGETLYRISKKYNVSLQDIYRLNNKSTDVISVGEKIIISDIDNSVSDDFGSIYTVQKGDTLYRIAKQNNISIEKLKSLNNLPSNNIYIGQKIRFQ